MSELIKIRDVSSRYDVTARTLRYYEDMGLIASTRGEDYAHRLYDEAAITRLKQILILRKLNISIKDIQHIFAASGSEAVLEVLGKKADDLDNEVALLHELKEIVLEFIRQIKQADFHNASDVKLLYEKAKEIETQLTTPDYIGNPSHVNRLMEVTEELDDKRITLPTAIRAYRQSIGAMRFIGKKYGNEDRVNGFFSVKWQEWFKNGWFGYLQNQLGTNLLFTEEGKFAEIGLMCHRDGDRKNFEYWIGYFTPSGTAVPEGFDYEDFPKMDIGTCWLYGKEPDVYGIEPTALAKLNEEGYEMITDWWFERYSPIRCNPDKKGNIIIDICFFIK